jgi:hypothetical protein
VVKQLIESSTVFAPRVNFFKPKPGVFGPSMATTANKKGVGSLPPNLVQTQRRGRFPTPRLRSPKKKRTDGNAAPAAAASN